MTARIAELEDQAEQARNRAAKFEKDKMKLQIEIRDISVELEAVTIQLRFTSACCDFRTIFTLFFLAYQFP